MTATFNDTFNNPLYTIEDGIMGVRATVDCRTCHAQTSAVSDTFFVHDRNGKLLTVLNIKVCLICGQKKTEA